MDLNLVLAWLTENVAVVSAVTALLAVLIGPLISLYVVRRQIRAQVVSVNRQEWINRLRKLVSEFVTEAATGAQLIVDPQQAQAENWRHRERLGLLLSETELLINPNEVDHRKLVEMMHGLGAQAKAAGGVPNVSPQVREITTITQKILKNEWNVVKKGK